MIEVTVGTASADANGVLTRILSAALLLLSRATVTAASNSFSRSSSWGAIGLNISFSVTKADSTTASLSSSDKRSNPSRLRRNSSRLSLSLSSSTRPSAFNAGDSRVAVDLDEPLPDAPPAPEVLASDPLQTTGPLLRARFGAGPRPLAVGPVLFAAAAAAAAAPRAIACAP